MGDKSPKSKRRDEQHKSQAKAQGAAHLKAKQDGFGRPLPPGAKGGK